MLKDSFEDPARSCQHLNFCFPGQYFWYVVWYFFYTRKVQLSLCKQEQFLNLWIPSNELAEQKLVKSLSFYLDFMLVYLIMCAKIQIGFILAGSRQPITSVTRSPSTYFTNPIQGLLIFRCFCSNWWFVTILVRLTNFWPHGVLICLWHSSFPFSKLLKEADLVFCYQNRSNILWEKKILCWRKTIEIQGWMPRIWFFWDH